jgi:hypothetical protein
MANRDIIGLVCFVLCWFLVLKWLPSNEGNHEQSEIKKDCEKVRSFQMSKENGKGVPYGRSKYNGLKLRHDLWPEGGCLFVNVVH